MTPLCAHTLQDLRAAIQFFATQRIRAVTALRILQIASPGGMDVSHIHWETRSQWDQKIYQHSYYDPKTLTIHPRPGFLQHFQIPSPECAASMHRVLHALLQKKFCTTTIALLIHLSDGPLRRHQITKLGWCKDFRTRPETLFPLMEHRLVEITHSRQPNHNQPTQLIHLSPAGKTLLLGHWGKAIKHPNTSQLSQDTQRAA